MKEHLLPLLCLAIGIPLLLVGIPRMLFYTLRLAGHRRSELPPSWHNVWGLNNANLLFFPSQLDGEGQAIQRKAFNAFIYVCVGCLFLFAAFYFLGKA